MLLRMAYISRNGWYALVRVWLRWEKLPVYCGFDGKLS